MARAYPATSPQDYGQPPESEWQSLRGELVALLDQVESQVARARREEEPAYQSISERMQALRFQMAEAEPDARHREALRSVRRAVDRFSERDEHAPPRPENMAPNPRDTLQSAIRQIRARQAEPVPGPRPAEAPLPPRFDELAQAVGGISGRLERLEGELRASTRSQTGNVKEIAEQVAQLSHVVELLAGAVGETGQVKRLEAQIAGLAKLVAQGPQIDFSGLTRRLDDMGATVRALIERQHDEGLSQRLDDVSATMGRLADLQVQFANRVDNSAKAAGGLRDGLAAIENQVRSVSERVEGGKRSAEGLRDGMAAIENGIRNIYDRIDALERAPATPPIDLDRLTAEMAELTAALRDSGRPEGIVELIDSINTRIGAIESSSRDVGALQLDLEALRNTVVEAMEPRFAAIEMQIETLTDRMAEPRGDINVGQLEAQVRQLVARMDQTGEQLTGLARLYSEPAAREPAPDFEALADMVAARTSEVVAAHAPGSLTGGGIDAADFDEIERRVSRLMETAARDKPAELSGIERSIHEVSERLARLEASLTERAKEVERLAAMPPPPMPTPAVITAPATAAPEAPAPTASAQLRPHDDAMPASPAVEAPLRDRPFGDDSPVKSALEAKHGPRQQHPGLSYGAEAAEGAAAAGRPNFDPAAVERPPRPTSAFDIEEQTPFPAAESTETPAPAVETPTEAPASTNTFIAAARRAAQRQTGAARTSAAAGSNSLIARAFHSFSAGNSADASHAETDSAGRKKPARPSKEKKGRTLAGDKPAPTAWKPDDEPAALDVSPPGAEAPAPIAIDQEATAVAGASADQESFLSRYRRPILLAASVVAIVFLTINLISQRLNESQPVTRSAPALDTSELEVEEVPSPLSSEPMATVPAAISGPRVVPIVDSLATASIDPAAATGFTPASGLPDMPSAFAAIKAPDESVPAAATEAIETAALAPVEVPKLTVPEPLDSPVQVEMPPETLGPEPLRAAAANGDARAQFEVAAIYTEGRAIPEDLAAAAVWYERAAAQGFAPAQYRLGNLYENGRGVEQDLQQARLWYQRAAEAGNRMAMHNLAALYAGGQLGKQDFASAAEWFGKAAARGMRDSQFNLGMLYARGLGVPQSFEESYKWFSLAALKGDADAAKARDDVAGSLDADAVSRLTGEIAAFVPESIDLAANFAPIGTWSDTFDPGETITNTDVVKSVQTALAGLGYAVGTPDGLIGPRTADAIRAFERATGMSESGAVNPRLLAVLGSQPV